MHSDTNASPAASPTRAVVIHSTTPCSPSSDSMRLNTSVPTPATALLAGARAARVVAVLETNGVATEQLLAVSFGESSPIASNDTPEGRAQNRRIEVRIRPVEIDTPDVAAGPPE